MPFDLLGFLLQHLRIDIHAVSDRCHLLDMRRYALGPVEMRDGSFPLDLLPRQCDLVDGVRYDGDEVRRLEASLR